TYATLFTQTRVYPLLTISYDDPRSRQRIAPDRDCGRNHDWNATIHLLCIPASILEDRDVGFVQIPLHDIIATPDDTRFVSYQVCRPLSAAAKLDQELMIACPPVGYYVAPQPYGCGTPAMPVGYGYAPTGYGVSGKGLLCLYYYSSTSVYRASVLSGFGLLGFGTLRLQYSPASALSFGTLGFDNLSIFCRDNVISFLLTN
ncbi:protein SRC2-like, partial [Phalaenopsis equestris]|uniref:protein SRC2-like n=1 Tax=Phalaenopsis equestris TaxID=78828 RepID=UPI0009E1EA69